MSSAGSHCEPFLVLVTVAQRMLYAFIFRLVPSMADADDILQETNLGPGASRRSSRRGPIFGPGPFALPASR